MEETCNHPCLTFGSGGHYVICTDCQATWVHSSGRTMTNEVAYLVDFRVAPEVLDPIDRIPADQARR